VPQFTINSPPRAARTRQNEPPRAGHCGADERGRYLSERTLFIHTIVNRRREAFCWLAILFTFVLGTSAGDLIAEKMRLGYLLSAGPVRCAHRGCLCFVRARHGRGARVLGGVRPHTPVRCVLGDFLTAAPHDGGLGLETTGTSELLLVVILAVVGWFSLQQRRTSARAEVKPLR
jgi:uncharacterized membrane-anchored protein